MSVIIRDMVAADVQYTAPLGREYHDEAPMKELTYSAEMTDHNFRIVVLDRSKFFCQVAIEETEYGNEYFGMLLACRITPLFSTDQMAQDMLFLVRKQWRARYPHVAVTLLKHYGQWAALHKLKLANISTISGIDSERTAEFYNRLGFIKLGTIHSLELRHG